jgi:hypothetical protein
MEYFTREFHKIDNQTKGDNEKKIIIVRCIMLEFF